VTSWPTSTTPEPATAPPKHSTHPSNTYAAQHWAFVTSPTTSPAAYSKQATSNPNYTPKWEELYYWHDATRETPTTAIIYVDAPTADEASLRGLGLFDQTFTNHEVQIVATETIRHEDAIARYEAGIRSSR